MAILMISIWIISVIIYFFSLRTMLSKDVDLDVDEFGKIFVILFIGLIPIVNFIYLIAMVIDYLTYSTNLKPNDVLKKILFIKDKRDERWR